MVRLLINLLPSDPTPNVFPTELTIMPPKSVIQNKALLSAIRCIDPLDSNHVFFNHENYMP